MINKNRSFRIGIIGCGALTRIFYIPVLKKLKMYPAVLVDPNIHGIMDLLKESGASNATASIDEAVPLIDAAIIASPNYLHARQANFLMKKGKHVLLEKPMTATEKDARELLSTSSQSSLVLQIGMMRRFWKINKAVKKMLDDRILGNLQTISMQEGGVLNWPVQSTAIFDPAQSLGGVLMDTGPHTIDLLCWWVGNEEYELQYEDDNHGGMEADCSLTVDFKKSGIHALIKLSRIRTMPNEYFLKGTKGWIKLKPFGNVFETSDRSIEKYIHNQYSSVGLKKQGIEDLFYEQVTGWLSAIELGSKPAIDAESVLPSIRLIEQCYLNRKQMEYAWN